MDTQRATAASNWPSADSELPLTVLLADDDTFSRELLALLVRAAGHEVIHASDGAEAVQRFQETRPDLVFMDVVMPKMDGYQATEAIKACSVDDHVPVIFITGLADTASLTKCLACGGDDFLTKPYNEIILKAKLNAHARIRRLTVALNERNRQLARDKERTEREHRVAERVFSKTLAAGQTANDAIRHHVSPLAIFNGDVFQSGVAPDGSLHVLLGDFTGHGLAAAIGTLPVSETFAPLVKKGLGTGSIAYELNRKLREILPDDMFFAATLITVNAYRDTARIWSGGLPDTLVVDPKGQTARRVHSQHMPLGILDDGEFDSSLQTIPLVAGERIYVYTDGIIEAHRSDTMQFGEDNLLAVLCKAQGASSRVESVVSALGEFLGTDTQSDDISLIEIECSAADTAILDGRHTEPEAAWQLCLPMRGRLLSEVNPIPQLSSLLSATPIPDEHRHVICTLLAELYSNAVEHGVLGMDSTIKQHEDGYIAYYDARKNNLRYDDQAFVNIGLSYTPSTEGGYIELSIQDSGIGFQSDPKMQHSPADKERFHGIDLIRGLCEDIRYDGETNTLSALYRWGNVAPPSEGVTGQSGAGI
jgi:CheY-like chemotaxis protein